MEVFVISVGGSLINPGKVNTRFLKELKKVILKHAKKNNILLCTGGGVLARDYMHALDQKESMVRSTMGVACTQLNAKLLALYIGNCNEVIPTTIGEVKRMILKHRIVIFGGITPGKTSDSSTAEIAATVGAKTMINLTNVNGLYDKDPKRYKDAKFIPKISHKEFQKIMDKVHEEPGQHFVLDSLAAKICQQKKINVIILKGTKNLEQYLVGKKFIGTIIS